jgi:hypothetical protein
VARQAAEGTSRRAQITWAVVLLAIVIGGSVVSAMVAEDAGAGSRLFGRWLLEIWLLVGLVAWSLQRVDVRGLLTVAQRIVAVVLVAGLLLSQFSFGRLGGYPFMPWGMYTVPQDRVVYADLVKFDGEDEVGRLPLFTLVPADARGFLSRIEASLRQADAGDQEAARVLALTIRRLLAANDDPAVDRIDLRWCETTGDGPELRTSCESALVIPR